MWLFMISFGDLVSKWCERPRQAVEDFWGKREKYMEDIGLWFKPGASQATRAYHRNFICLKAHGNMHGSASPSRQNKGWSLSEWTPSQKWSLPLNSQFMPFMTMSGGPWAVTQISSSHYLSMLPSRGRPSMSVAKLERFVGHLFLDSDGGWGKVLELRITSATIVRACPAIQTCGQSLVCASSEDFQNNAWVRPIEGWLAYPSRHGLEPFLSLPSIRNSPLQICDFARFIPPTKSATLCRLEIYTHTLKNGWRE